MTLNRLIGSAPNQVSVNGMLGNLAFQSAESVNLGSVSVQQLLAPLGTAGAPTFTFTGDDNTGLYSPGADQVALSTGGVEQLRISSDGKVGIGNTTPSHLITVSPAFNTDAVVKDVAYFCGNNPSLAGAGARITFGSNVPNSPNRGCAIVGLNTGGGDNAHAMVFEVSSASQSPSERLRIDSSGRVGIGTTSPGHLLQVSDKFAVDNSNTFGRIYLQRRSGTSLTAMYIQGADQANTNSDLSIVNTSGGGSAIEIAQGTTTAAIKFFTNGPTSERARIDSSGRLLVGTSSALSVVGNQSGIQVESTSADYPHGASFVRHGGTTAAAGPVLALGRSRGTSAGAVTAVANNDALGYLAFAGSNGTDFSNQAAQIKCEVDGEPFTAGDTTDLPGRLVFSTTADGASSPTEVMRLTSDNYMRMASGTGGLQFGGDTAAANALDDYEEGSWTPTIIGTTASGTGTYSRQVGRYTKIGNKVHVQGIATWSAHTGTGFMRMTGLPFTALNVADLFSAVAFHVSNITSPANTIVQGYTTHNTSFISIASVLVGGGASANVTMDTAGELLVSVSYVV